MKPASIVWIFFAVVITCSSCATPAKLEANRELRRELAKYADVLQRYKADLYGGGYSWIGSTTPRMDLKLYLRAEHSSREAVIATRDHLVTFFLMDNWSAFGVPAFVKFYGMEGKESVLLYYATYIPYDGIGARYGASGYWTDEEPQESHYFFP